MKPRYRLEFVDLSPLVGIVAKCKILKQKTTYEGMSREIPVGYMNGVVYRPKNTGAIKYLLKTYFG